MLTEGVEAELNAALDGPITVDITTIGRQSGELRRIEIWMVNVDGRIAIGGTPGNRDWFANVRENADITVHFKQTTIADVAASAREVVDLGVRRTTWNHRSTAWYRRNTSVDDLVANAPLVELSWR